MPKRMLLARSHAHTIHSTSQHLDWDSSRLPVLRAAPGDEVEFREIDAMCGQITAQTREEELPGLDPARINPVSGPVYVEGAEPGDSVTVTLLGFESQGWGWTAVFPDFGLLQRDFSTPAIHHWTYDRTFGQAAAYGRWAKVPLRPFCGTVGVAQAAPGSFSTLPPYRTGGNMDIRDLTEGVVLHLPVEVPGALVSIGDPHAAQGDGEVCGTALESPMSVRARLGLVKGERLRFPRFASSGPLTRHIDSRGYDATTGIGPDLMEAACDAVRGMIDLLAARERMNAEVAYMLCSVCGDLRISEIVDAPNWVVSFYMPRAVFD
jgi:acetamidase/formamidase